jgi:hypothetical protein
MEASCHCGAVRLEVARRPRQLTECNCSLCRRYGALWAYYSTETARVLRGRKTLARYTWGPATRQFFHCKRCGCITHYERAPKRGVRKVGVNARMFDPADIASVRVRRFDGAASWKYLD